MMEGQYSNQLRSAATTANQETVGENVRTFYTLLLYCTRLELAYFKTVQHSSKHIKALIADERAYEKALWDLDHPLHIN